MICQIFILFQPRVKIDQIFIVFKSPYLILPDFHSLSVSWSYFARFPYFYNVLHLKWPDFNTFTMSLKALKKLKKPWTFGLVHIMLGINISTLVEVDNTYRCRVSGSSESSSIHETSHAHANLLHFRF